MTLITVSGGLVSFGCEVCLDGFERSIVVFPLLLNLPNRKLGNRSLFRLLIDAFGRVPKLIVFYELTVSRYPLGKSLRFGPPWCCGVVFVVIIGFVVVVE